MISRFYDPQAGSICIDDQDLRDLDLKSMRDHIGIVSQEPLLFDDTIAENIARGSPKEVSMEDIIAAAKAANAYDFIQTFPDGFETKVGARGGKLSGGQKQRIASEFTSYLCFRLVDFRLLTFFSSLFRSSCKSPDSKAFCTHFRRSYGTYIIAIQPTIVLTVRLTLQFRLCSFPVCTRQRK